MIRTMNIMRDVALPKLLLLTLRTSDDGGRDRMRLVIRKRTRGPSASGSSRSGGSCRCAGSGSSVRSTVSGVSGPASGCACTYRTVYTAACCASTRASSSGGCASSSADCGPCGCDDGFGQTADCTCSGPTCRPGSRSHRRASGGRCQGYGSSACGCSCLRWRKPVSPDAPRLAASGQEVGDASTSNRRRARPRSKTTSVRGSSGPRTTPYPRSASTPTAPRTTSR